MEFHGYFFIILSGQYRRAFNRKSLKIHEKIQGAHNKLGFSWESSWFVGFSVISLLKERQVEISSLQENESLLSGKPLNIPVFPSTSSQYNPSSPVLNQLAFSWTLI